MPLDNQSGSLSERATAAMNAAHKVVSAAKEKASTPRSVKRGVNQGNALISEGDSAPAPQAEKSAAKPGRKSRSVKTSDTLKGVLDRFEFDWFQGVMPNSRGGGDCVVGGPEEAHAIARAVRFFESHGLRFGEPGGGGKGYANGLPFMEGTGTEKVASVLSGSHTGGMPNIGLSGGKGLCALLAPLMQAEFPGLRITRADAALDLIDADAFRLLLTMSRRFVQARRMSAIEMQGFHQPEKGRTFYVGSKQAEVRLRVYEKGKKEIGEGNAEADPAWVRIEFQFANIKGEKKAAFGKLSPGEMVRAYDWPRIWLGVAAKTLGLTKAIERAARMKIDQEPKVRDLERTTDYGAAQYGKAFVRLAAAELIRDRHNGDAAGAAIPIADLERKAAVIFLRKLRQSGKAEAVIENDRLDVSETPEQRAEAMAVRQQALRFRDLETKSRARNRLAMQVSNATSDPEGVKRLRGKAIEADARLAQAEDYKDAVEAEWAARLDGKAGKPPAQPRPRRKGAVVWAGRKGSRQDVSPAEAAGKA